jgi:hypothetical protein
MGPAVDRPCGLRILSTRNRTWLHALYAGSGLMSRLFLPAVHPRKLRYTDRRGLGVRSFTVICVWQCIEVYYVLKPDVASVGAMQDPGKN